MRKHSGLGAALAAGVPTAVLDAVPALSYEEGAVSGGGIEGKVVYKGTMPTRKIIRNKDVEVRRDIREEPLIGVGSDQGVENAVVYLAEIGTGKAWAAAGHPPELYSFKCRFVPEVQATRGGPLVVVNSDPVLHNTHGYYGNSAAFNMASRSQGQRIPPPGKTIPWWRSIFDRPRTAERCCRGRQVEI
jgi:hypothetical protein